MKITMLKNGAYVTFEKTFPSGYYRVRAVSPSGKLLDKVSRDSYRDALAYRRSFLKLAKNS